jgi:hypothetical protein
MSVEIVRLTTGEELLCDVKKTEEGYHLTDVAIIIPTQENSLALMPFMPYSVIKHVGIKIQKENVMFMVEPHGDLLNRHKEIYSKIVLPNSDLITK